MPTPLYSIVLPIFNEAENLPGLFREIITVMERLGRFEVICVDDGSQDQSRTVITEMSATDPRFRLLALSANRGQSTALWAGCSVATGTFIITLDADLQNDPADLANMVPYLESYDMVSGWRKDRQDPWLKRISSSIANAIRNRLTHEDIKDTGCSLKIMRTSILRQVRPFDGMHRFLPTLMKMAGAKVKETPVRHRPRIAGRSNYGVINRAVSSFLDLLAVRWMQKRQLHYTIEIQK